jgi:hypothetical protein
MCLQTLLFRRNLVLKLINATFVATVFWMAAAHADIVSTTVDCASVNDGYIECNSGLAAITQATLVSENVPGSCVYGSTWGTYNAFVWVNHGCSGRFTVNADNTQPVPTPPVSNPPVYRVVDCRWNSVNWQPFYKPDGHFIGRAGFGFQDTYTCVSAVQMATKHAVCNWTGNGFTPYDIESNLELANVAYPTLQMCYDQVP